MMNRLLKTLIIIIMIGMIASAGSGDEAKSRDKKGSAKKVEKVIKLKEIEIKGEVKKPQAVFFLPRSKFTMDDMIVTESFIENIVNVVDKE
jgi:hypothetical protein